MQGQMLRTVTMANTLQSNVNSGGNKLSVLSYNMHGFNQGYPYLTETCEADLYDIIFIQEH